MKRLLKPAVVIAVLALFGCGEQQAKATSTSSRSSVRPAKSITFSTTKVAQKPAVRSVASTPKVVRPVARPAPKPAKRVYVSNKKQEIEYFAFADCTRHITVGFNGYKCIDRD